MITHAATLDVSTNLLRMVTHLIWTARRGPGRLPRARAATARAQALLVISFLRDAPPIWRLAAATGISTATASPPRFAREVPPATCTRAWPPWPSRHRP